MAILALLFTFILESQSCNIFLIFHFDLINVITLTFSSKQSSNESISRQTQTDWLCLWKRWSHVEEVTLLYMEKPFGTFLNRWDLIKRRLHYYHHF